MRIEFELWHLVSLMITVIGAFWTLAKIIALQTKADIERQFRAISDELKAQGQSTQRLERELMELKAELPRDYVRREDFTRVISTFEVKVDNLRLTIERLILSEGRTRD